MLVKITIIDISEGKIVLIVVKREVLPKVEISEVERNELWKCCGCLIKHGKWLQGKKIFDSSISFEKANLRLIF